MTATTTETSVEGLGDSDPCLMLRGLQSLGVE